MSKVRANDTKPELLIRSYLHRQGFRFRLYRKDLPGKPDIVLPKYKTIIFVNGCFWHGHENCKAAKLPQTRHEFWRNKIAANVERDKLNIWKLEQEGWKVILVWQCDLKSKVKREHRLESLILEIKK